MPIVPVDPTKNANNELPRPRVRVRTRPVPQSVPSGPDSAVDGPPSAGGPEYAVGYGKPPRQHQFRPGRSGNPKGRPKAAKGLSTIVRDTLTQKVAVRTSSGEKKITRIEAVLQKTVEQAMKGNPRALAELLKLYGHAVPDEREDIDHDREEDLTATDLATLEELRRMLGGEQEQVQ